MNKVTKRNRLMDQIDSYAAFIAYCPKEDKHRVITEMARLSVEVERIKTMTLAELHLQVDEYTDVVPSKLNTMEITFNIERINYGKRTA